MGYIGGGVVLVVIGAILMYAVEVNIPGIDSNTLAVILMVAGVVLFVIGLLFAMRSRSRRVPDDRY
ncbi:membrane-bound ClpP family serine protease [Dietzia sp. 2505]|jgi:membrane-bound ClpP family serine protease|uniref:hypothetical protein n=1 Tax=Dietzia TaxID=37914 RepID=UPI0015F932B0|nr:MULTISPECIES: hypothetical protein [Dietzia]MBB1034849.1 hypothetical protein [Dietzia sp. CQ4]MBB1038156.1 hypothetical protein [Dietzia natronolimnaea]MBB1041357.1 hypothetical protein [Dietzia sp. Cai40]MBB1046084.1 hypothetical protein [Dietzia sp. DQ11-44]MCT1516551.1 hypothetical protein [Dietzia cercidiphylli]